MGLSAPVEASIPKAVEVVESVIERALATKSTQAQIA
jgi:hypothetical protein